MALPGLFKNLIEGGLKGLGDTAKGIIQQVGENKLGVAEAALAIEKEINRASEAIMSDATKQLELELKDRADSRDMNAKIQESDKASWLAKNVAYILDISITTGFFSLIAMIAYKVVPEENKELFYMVVGILGAKWGDVVAFHRGSSKGSEEKQKSLDRISKKHD